MLLLLLLRKLKIKEISWVQEGQLEPEKWTLLRLWVVDKIAGVGLYQRMLGQLLLALLVMPVPAHPLILLHSMTSAYPITLQRQRQRRSLPFSPRHIRVQHLRVTMAILSYQDHRRNH